MKPVPRRLAAAFALIFALFSLNIATYAWNRRQRDRTFEQLQQALTRHALLDSLHQQLSAQRREAARVAAQLGDAKAVAADPVDLNGFERRVEPIRLELRALESLSEDGSPEVGTFADETQDLVRSWRVAYENLGVDRRRSIDELSSRAEPLAQKVVAERLPRIEATERIRIASARQRFYAAARTADEATVVVFVLSVLVGLFVAGRASRETASASRELEQQVDERTRQLLVQMEDRRRAEERMEHQAYHDTLTGLPNRVLVKDRLQLALAHAHRNRKELALMILDVDDFKLINDTLGHSAGDELLQTVASRLTACVREDDTIGRVGGDEFVLLLPGIQRGEDAAKLAQKLLDTVARPVVVGGQELSVTTSVGIGMYPADGDDVETLLKNADSAMYRAKESGRNNYQLFTSAMNERAALRLSLENGLRRALKQGELVLHYQPIVRLSDGVVVAVEALVRWQHPERGLMLPSEFVPLAEDSRLIFPLGEWVLGEACRQARAWRDAGLPPLRLSVNLSARQFQQRELVRLVHRALKEAALEPRWLELELTESAAMQNIDLTVGMLHGLRDMGVRLAIDDFGTGHSSLSYLKRFPVDTVKIDQSFVRDMTIDPYDAAIVSAVVSMAHSLRLSCVAEGVETAEQAAFLKGLRCDEMQGFLVCKPRPADAVEPILRNRRVVTV